MKDLFIISIENGLAQDSKGLITYYSHDELQYIITALQNTVKFYKKNKLTPERIIEENDKRYDNLLLQTSSCSINEKSGKKISHQKTYLMYDSNTNLTKIGKSKNPTVREKTLQSEKPTISLFAICNDDIEDSLHIDYAEYRVRGEWFNLSEHQLDEIIEDYNFRLI